MISLLRFFYWLALLGLVSLQATALLGSHIYAFDAINHFQPFLLLVSVLSLIIAILLFGKHIFRPFHTLLLGFPFVVSSVMVLPHLASHWLQASTPIATSEAGSPLKVISFNLWAGNYKQDQVVAFVREENPDVILFQEFAALNRRLLKAFRTDYPYQVHCAHRAHCKVGILSRYRLTDEAIQPFSFRQGAKPKFLDRVFGEKPERPSGPIASARLHLPGAKPVHLITAHLRWPLPGDRQRQQFHTLLGELKNHPSERTLLTGDFNSTPWSFALGAFDKAAGLERHTKAIWTFPTPRFYEELGGYEGIAFLPIDQIYSGSDLRLISLKRGPYVGSDHYPLIAEFAISP
ncbi:endonuclease/exonuclease/phosphatase family protein [Coralliovum pocilloporae]|uniref:endonuclease/exonuclease/phosphatase family protein n=1 Tax=Coralliovum pocilloporae TaxID=3066369 RepID=UPI003306E5F0